MIPIVANTVCVREWSFLILGTGADDSWQGYETFPIIRWGYETFKKHFMGYKTILLFTKEMFMFL